MGADGSSLRRIATRLHDWLHERWDGPEKIRAFLGKPLPRNVGWLHTLGGLLLLYILFQTLTGILLGLYYNPGPDHAYESIRYIREELFLGRFLHQLHRYGAGFIMVVMFLHLMRSYFLGSYKKPRELLWLTGLALAILLTLFAFTGQLLPMDQRGYWATIVGIEIASSAPGMGETVRALLTGGYGDIGAVTLSRFYILHVAVLPLVMFGLIGLHLGILQRTGSTGPASGDAGPTRPFFPGQAAKDMAVAAIGALALCIVAAMVETVETGPANPAPGTFEPRPEWFFLSHYEILKVLPRTLGAFILPNLLLAALVLLPFVDRRPGRSFRERKLLTGIGIVGCAGLIGLTALGVLTGPDLAGTGTADDLLDPVEHGRALFAEKKCITCHTIGDAGGTEGPNLTHVASRLRADYFPDWIRNPQSFKPDTDMPAFEGTEDELSAVVEYLLTQD